MKRSEMLNIMLESYCKEVPYHDDGGIQLQWKLVRLLEDMEEAGILPPKIELGDSGFVKTTEILDYTELDYDVIWEPEDG